MRERRQIDQPQEGRATSIGGATDPRRSLEALGHAIGNRALARLVQDGAIPRRAVARDLKQKHKVDEGEFKLALETQHPAGGKNGLKGTISFRPKDSAPDSTSIRLYQAVRNENLETAGEYVWTGTEEPRNKMQTVEDKASGMAGGWFIDHFAGSATPRTSATDPNVSVYYRDYAPNPAESHDGSKAGKTIVEASLWDFPGSHGNRRFSFETVAQAADTGHYYGSVFWTFTVKDASKGEVTGESAYGRNVTLATTDEALRRFNEYYRNPGASTAPK
jgi:hypothetical protein